MALPKISMRNLIEVGAHFGHRSNRWNPKMAPYIFGARDRTHILDLSQSVPMLKKALQAVADTAARGGRILFVGTKRQAQNSVAASARQSAQYYVNSRWLGGTLTNWKTISASIQRLRRIEATLGDGGAGLTKKELMLLAREREKLERALGGIKEMGGPPDLVFVIDTNKEALAIREAKRLGIPVVAIVDTNSDPDDITYPVPANDDSGRAIQLYCDLVARSVLDGLSRWSDEPPSERQSDVGLVLERLPDMSPDVARQLRDAGVADLRQLAKLGASADDLDRELGLGGKLRGWIEGAQRILTWPDPRPKPPKPASPPTPVDRGEPGR